jgi:hypothetical protein
MEVEMLSRDVLAFPRLVVIVLLVTACATRSNINDDSRPMEEAYVLNGIYEFEAEVDARGIAGEPTRIVVLGTITFALGEFIELENDYSSPCDMNEFEQPRRARTVIECPNFRLSILRDREPSSQSTIASIRVDSRWWRARTRISRKGHAERLLQRQVPQLQFLRNLLGRDSTPVRRSM